MNIVTTALHAKIQFSVDKRFLSHRYARGHENNNTLQRNIAASRLVDRMDRVFPVDNVNLGTAHISRIRSGTDGLGYEDVDSNSIVDRIVFHSAGFACPTFLTRR